MTLPGWLAHSPDAAVGACVLGILLIYIEMNRPGLIVPGALGLLTTLLGAAALARYPLSPSAVSLLVAASVLLLWGVRRRGHWLLGVISGLALAAGFHNLIRLFDGPGVSLPIAVFAGIFLGPGTWLLTAIARRARVNKGLD